ncbi:ribosomal protein S18-alanine N-acetyltransferase [Carnobacteriaceae bacterium zg-C25]|nr:ribosomal protein S18-alanine N-acetyltransferase [Carnobacteriaceae bacterium zg-C25]
MKDKIKQVYEIAQQVGFSWSLEAFEQHMRDENVHYIVSKDGFIALSIVLDEAEIVNVAVMPSRQNQGVGKWLWQETLNMFDTYGVVKCFLEVRASNQKAQRFYEQCGFMKIAERKNYYTKENEDAWVYCWEKK